MRYRNAVKVLAINRDGMLFPNATPIHANIVMTNIFNISSNNVRIYDSDLSGDIAELSGDEYKKYTDEHKESIEKFLSKGNTKLQIIVKNPDKESVFKSFLIGLSEKYPKRLIIKIADKEMTEAVKKVLKYDFNFTVGDESIFRQEYLDNNERKALCSFNNNSQAGKLASLFSNQYERLNELQIA